MIGDARSVVLDLDHQGQADAPVRSLHRKANAGPKRRLHDDAALLLVVADGLGGVLDEVQEGLHELVAIARHRRQRGVVVLDEADAAGKARLAQAADVLEHVVDVDRLLGERALVAEHLHAVDEIADAIRLRADELGQRAIGIRDALLQELSRAADARQRVLDLVREHRGEARRRAGGGAMRELALDHDRHVALLQHQHDEARADRQTDRRRRRRALGS